MDYSYHKLSYVVNDEIGHLRETNTAKQLKNYASRKGAKPQRKRLSMKPGFTCIWQINSQRNEVSFEEWMHMDLKYIDNWSLWLDFKILFGTAKVVLLGAGR